MKKLKTHRYLLVTVMGLLVACTSYTSTDEWPNPRPNSNPDPEPVIGEITSIQSLNKSENVAVNSHADEWGNSSLELDSPVADFGKSGTVGCECSLSPYQEIR